MIYRRTYVGILCEILFRNRAEFSIDLKNQQNHNLNHFARMHFYYGRLCPRPPNPYRWKAETVSFLHVLLVWGVKLTSLLTTTRQN